MYFPGLTRSNSAKWTSSAYSVYRMSTDFAYKINLTFLE